MASGFEVRDEVWEAVEPLLPAVEGKGTGRPRVPDRTAFCTPLGSRGPSAVERRPPSASTPS